MSSREQPKEEQKEGLRASSAKAAIAQLRRDSRSSALDPFGFWGSLLKDP